MVNGLLNGMVNGGPMLPVRPIAVDLAVRTASTGFCWLLVWLGGYTKFGRLLRCCCLFDDVLRDVKRAASGWTTLSRNIEAKQATNPRKSFVASYQIDCATNGIPVSR